MTSLAEDKVEMKTPHANRKPSASGILGTKPKRPMKYVVVTGGVVSGLGKGITISSTGVLLQACGLRTTSIKIDPYLNSDAGTMSPFEHGECFVMDDGGEADLDLGNYERFLSVTLTKVRTFSFCGSRRQGATFCCFPLAIVLDPLKILMPSSFWPQSSGPQHHYGQSVQPGDPA